MRRRDTDRDSRRRYDRDDREPRRSRSRERNRSRDRDRDPRHSDIDYDAKPTSYDRGQLQVDARGREIDGPEQGNNGMKKEVRLLSVVVHCCAGG